MLCPLGNVLSGPFESRQYDLNPSLNVLPDGTPVPAYNGSSVGMFIWAFGYLDLLSCSKYDSLVTLRHFYGPFSGEILGQSGFTK